MNLRTLTACLAVSSALFVAACGDDDEDKQGGTTTTTPTATQEEQATAKPDTITKDIKPRAAAPNVVGGDAPIEEFAQKSAHDAANYWQKVFDQNGLTYKRPTVNFLTQPGDNGCGGEFDPTQKPYVLCTNPGVPAIVTLSGTQLEEYRSQLGDASVSFLAGYGVTLDATDQLYGSPLANGKEVPDAFANVAVCFTGAWLRNVGDRELLEAGDSKEVMDVAATFLPGEIGFGSDVVAFGHDNGGNACQKQYGGGSEG